LKVQNTLLLISSYIFYGWWDWRFLTLIIISSFADYFIGLKIYQSNNDNKCKLLLLLSVLINIGFLGYFKYFNFFIDNFTEAFTFFGITISANRLNIILPVGISFYTFQTLSYTIDIYKNKLKPAKDIISFFAFVSFFPQLVAGPIERAINLLPQFYTKRKFSYSSATNGLRQILWGLFKKIVIADNLAVFVNDIFNNSTDYSGSTLLIGGIFFAFQIYCDFSGYSDIAIGTGRLFGFNLMRNFAFPYFSRDIAEFWRRWHISLSTWFRDYVYIPFGGSRGSLQKKIRNIFIIFLISGFWHGANWTFLMWGFLNALYFIPLMIYKKNRINTNTVAEGKIFPSIKELVQMGITFLITVLAWIFFRAENLTHAFNIISSIFSSSILTLPEVRPKMISIIISFFIIIEWFGREHQYAIENIKNIFVKPVRWLSYLIIIFIIYFSGNFSDSIEFIYFQF